MRVREPLELHALTAKPTDRQALGWVPFEEIVAKRDALPLGSDARLLLAMYTEIPSRRNDYGILPIYGTAPAAGTAAAEGNYLVLPASPAQQGTPGHSHHGLQVREHGPPPSRSTSTRPARSTTPSRKTCPSPSSPRYGPVWPESQGDTSLCLLGTGASTSPRPPSASGQTTY